MAKHHNCLYIFIAWQRKKGIQKLPATKYATSRLSTIRIAITACQNWTDVVSIPKQNKKLITSLKNSTEITWIKMMLHSGGVG